MLITLPPPYASNAKERSWPTVESPKGVSVRATQRDLRRFRHLQTNVARLLVPPPGSSTATASAPAPAPGPQPVSSISGSANTSPRSDAATTSGIRLSPSGAGTSVPEQVSSLNLADYETEKIVEPTTWAALAYSGFMWWASAGEQRRGEEADEASRDAALFAELGGLGPTMSGTPGLLLADSVASLAGQRGDDEDERARVQLAIIAYFHRLTTQMLAVLADIVETSDDDDMLDVDVAAASVETDSDRAGLLSGAGIDEEEEEVADDESRGPWVRVDSDALANMGLDVWSESAAEFVRELTPRYFGRRAWVEGKGVEVCGLRVC